MPVVFVRLVGFQVRATVAVDGAVDRAVAKEGTGRPVIITERHVVADVSENAAGLGVWMGNAVRSARHAAPGGRYMEADRAGLEELGRRLGDRCLALTPWVEPAGPGAVYLDLRWTGNWRRELETLLTSLPPALGWWVCAGVAANKMLAHAAASLELEAPPRATPPRAAALPAGRLRGVSRNEVSPGGEGAFLKNLPLKYLSVLPEGFAEEAARLEVRTAGDVLEIPEGILLTRFGPQGMIARAAALGLDARRVRAAYPSERLVEELSLPEELEGHAALAVVPELALRAAAGLAERLAAAGKGCLSLEVCVLPGGERARRRLSAKPLCHPGELAGALESLLLESLRGSGRRPIIGGLGAVAGDLVRPRTEQLQLLPGMPGMRESTPGIETRARTQKWGLEGAMAALNRKFPDQPLRFGRELPVPRRERALMFFDLEYRGPKYHGKAETSGSDLV